MIYCTYEQIMKDCGINDKKSVASVLKILQETETIVKTSQSHYMLNPAVMLQGDNQKFGLIAATFNEVLMAHKSKMKKEKK